MCEVQMLRALVKQRLTAAAEEIFVLFERTITKYEEELFRSKEKNERQQKLLDAVFNPQLQLHRADVQQMLVVKEEVPLEQQEWCSRLEQEAPDPLHITEEQEELRISQEGEQPQGLEVADIKFTFTPVPVKSEDVDEEKPQSSQLHHQRRTEQMEIEADGKDCGGPEPARNSDPEPNLVDKTGDCSEPETDDSDDWNETREPCSGLHSLTKSEEPRVSYSRCRTSKKQFRCSDCDKRFCFKGSLKIHMKIHTGEKPFSCSVCKKSFVQNGNLQRHTLIHTGGKRFSCSVCNETFICSRQVKKHKCFGIQSSQLNQCQTGKNREAEPPASGSTEQMETEADKEDCGGPELARNSELHRHPEPDTVAKTGDPSERETDDSDDLKETREPQSDFTSLMKSDEVPGSDSRSSTGEKPFSCAECTKTFTTKGHLKRHLKIHARRKPVSCLICKKSFRLNKNLQLHMRIHTGQKAKKHKKVGRQSSQRHQSQSEENREAEPPASRSAEQMETEADGVDRGVPEPARNSDPDTHLQLDTVNKTGDYSNPESGERFGGSINLLKYSRVYTEQMPFRCSVYENDFTLRANSQPHMDIQTEMKRFKCSDCKKTFTWRRQINRHECVRCQPSQLHQSQTERNKEGEPPASRSTKQIETEADGEDCGGPESARNSDPDTHPEVYTADKSGDVSKPDPENNDSDDSDFWKENSQ